MPKPHLVPSNIEVLADIVDYPRILPGEYRGYCRRALFYKDRNYKRWVAFLEFDVFPKENLFKPLCRLCLFLPAGDLADKFKSPLNPRASRRSKLWALYLNANGLRPAGKISMSAFTRRFGIIRVRNTSGGCPYSVVDSVLSWDGPVNHPITQSG